MTRKQFDARLVAWDTAITSLNMFECDSDDDNAVEETRQAQILADQFEKACRRWQKTVRLEP